MDARADCTMWRRIAPAAFPRALDEQLRRLGIEKDKPTDLYASPLNEQMLYYRVMFHVAGKLVSGPAAWVDGIEHGKMHNYHVVQSKPTWVGLRVSTVRASFEYAPKMEKAIRSDVSVRRFPLTGPCGRDPTNRSTRSPRKRGSGLTAR